MRVFISGGFAVTRQFEYGGHLHKTCDHTLTQHAHSLTHSLTHWQLKTKHLSLSSLSAN